MAGFTDKPVSKRTEDMFGVTKYIDGLCGFIRDCNTPMTVAVQGDWGSGKTSFMLLIKEELKDSVLPVWFNTWQFSQFHLGDQLPILLVSRLVDSLGVKSESISKNLHTLGKFIFRVGVSTVSTISGVDVSGAAETFSSEENVTEAISSLKARFQECVEKALERSKKDRLVIFVDDLDRLEPQRAVELLEVLKLFLDCEHCVFLLAIDYAVVSQGIRQKYGETMELDKGRNFFDKIIQVPFKMPVAHYDIGKYVKKALDGMKLSVQDVGPYVELIRTSIGYNPRGIKRLLNAFLLLQRIHQGEDLNQEHKKRMLFAVLCLQLSYEEVYNFVVRNGSQLTPDFFAQLCETRWYDLSQDEETGDEEEPGSEESELLLQELFDNWEFRETDVRKITDFMQSFYQAVASEEGKLTDEDLQSLQEILNFAAVTSADSEPPAGQVFTSNGVKGKGIRYENVLDEEAAYHAIDEPIPYNQKRKLPGWNGSKLEAFRLFGKEREVHKYSDMVCQVLEILYAREPEKFRQIRENAGQYKMAALFYGNGGKIAVRHEVGQTGIVIEGKMSQQDKILNLRRMLHAMGYSEKELELKVRLAHRKISQQAEQE